MNVKILTGWTEKGMEKKIHEFINDSSIEVIDIKLTSQLIFLCTMVLYNEKPEQS